jgi:type I restriction enzyme S subunit
MEESDLNVETMLRTSAEIAKRFSRSTVIEGDIVYALRGKLGEVRQVNAEVAGANLTQGTARLSPGNGICSDFLLWMMRSPRSIQQAELQAKGTTFREITLADLRSLKIPVPSEREQHEIVEALRDADRLVALLEQLIAKKRGTQQGAMQDLLGPRSGWIEHRLGEVAQLKARIGWHGLKTMEYLDDGEFYLVTGTDFSNGFIDWSSCHFVDKRRYDQDKYIQLQENDVLVTKDGTIGKVAFMDKLPKRATLNSGVFVIRPLEKAFRPMFFYYLLMSHAFDEFLAKLSAGSTINHLYQKDFVGFTFHAPRMAQEQDEIAGALWSMDEEINVLEGNLAKARLLKQGMMQELLTGRIRLV